MSAPHTFLLSWLSVCQKLPKFVGYLTKFRQNQVGKFFGPPCKSFFQFISVYCISCRFCRYVYALSARSWTAVIIHCKV